MNDFDLIIAGAGTGGSVAAITAAKAGLRVCLIDVKPQKDIGIKICGDAIGQHHFKNLGLKEPSSGEIERIMEGVKIVSPDEQTSYVVKGEKLYGYILNRHRFGQRLVGEALDAGAVLFDETLVLGPVVEKGSVKGLSIKDLDRGKKRSLTSPVIVEATGFSATIRKKLPPEQGIDLKVDNRDVEACYREIRVLEHQLDEPTLCQIHLNQTISPGGYYWIFPESGRKVNVGLGVALVDGFPNPKDNLYKHVLSQPLFKGSTTIDAGAWCVPTRRPLDTMVGNGIIIVGDAACQVNPIHGGGMGPSMIGGTLAGETVSNALEQGSVDRETLWGYNVQYVRDYGAKQAGLEVFRILLQNMDDEELNKGMSQRLLTEEEVLKASMGEDARFTINEKVRIAFRGIKKLGFLRRLRAAAKAMREIRAWYRRYPHSIRDFEEWKAGAESIFERATLKMRAQKR